MGWEVEKQTLLLKYLYFASLEKRKKLVRRAWERNNRCKENSKLKLGKKANRKQQRNKREHGDTRVTDLSPDQDKVQLGKVTQPRAVVFSPGTPLLAQPLAQVVESSASQSTEHHARTGHVALSLTADQKSLRCSPLQA